MTISFNPWPIPKRKLTEAQVRNIRELFRGNPITMYNTIAKKYKVNESTIRKIINGKAWRNIV